MRDTQIERSKSPGPGTKQFKFKKERIVGECDVLGCKAKAKSPRSFRCKAHMKAVRKVQLKMNNKVWRKRVKAKEAGHHTVYTNPNDDKPRRALSAWARGNIDRAKKVVEQEATIIDMEEFKKLTKAKPTGKIVTKKVTPKVPKAKAKPAAKPAAKKAKAKKARPPLGIKPAATVVVPKNADGSPMMVTTKAS